MKTRKYAICEYAETPIIYKSGRSAYAWAGDAVDQILNKTGLDYGVIDGLSVTIPLSEASNPFFSVYMTEALGITPTWLNVGGIGGCSATGGVARAVAAIQSGACEVAIVLAADAPSTQWRADYGAYRPEYQDPPGVQGPPAAFGLLMNRYAYQYGLDERALGKIAITQRDHALGNPNGLDRLQKKLSMEAYLESRMISDPLRLLDCVMYSDGANAVLVTSEERAKTLGLKKRAYPTGYREITNFNGRNPTADITLSGFTKIGPALLSDVGLAPSDISMFHPYDDFTIAVMMQLEAFGFCEIGKGSDYVNANDFHYNGDLPLNTGGGQISAGQPGLAGGGLNLVEGVRQLFGEGHYQVRNPKNALVTGIGVIPYGRNWSVNAAMILEI